MNRGLPLVEKIAVGIEHLNPGRHIDDIEPIARIDGNRPRFAESPLRDAGPAPNFFQLAGRTGLTYAAGRGKQDHRKRQ